VAENTCASFARAIALGADAVEADVCVTSDGRFVLWHDADPDDAVALVRQAGGEKLLYAPVAPERGDPDRRPVAALSLAEFRRGHGYRLAGEPPEGEDKPPARAGVETLEDLLDWSEGEPRLRRVYLDVKLPAELSGEAPRLVEALTRRAAAGRIPGRLSFRLVSPQKEVYLRLRETVAEARGLDVAALADFELPDARVSARAIAARRVGLGLGRRLFRSFRAEVADLLSAKERGELDEVFVWTVNGRRRLAQIVRLAPDALLTDDPEILREIVDSA
jgi:glycerophosphoryl diester phosphodiesterase